MSRSTSYRVTLLPKYHFKYVRNIRVLSKTSSLKSQNVTLANDPQSRFFFSGYASFPFKLLPHHLTHLIHHREFAAVSMVTQCLLLLSSSTYKIAWPSLILEFLFFLDFSDFLRFFKKVRLWPNNSEWYSRLITSNILYR